MPVPRRVLLEEKQVVVEWSDGHRSRFANRNLREACPCALCAGESAPLGRNPMIPLTPAAPPDIMATAFSMVGRYAVSFVWSDGHSSGIYPYEYLLKLCECESCAGKRKSAVRA